VPNKIDGKRSENRRFKQHLFKKHGKKTWKTWKTHLVRRVNRCSVLDLAVAWAPAIHGDSYPPILATSSDKECPMPMGAQFSDYFTKL